MKKMVNGVYVDMTADEIKARQDEEAAWATKKAAIKIAEEKSKYGLSIDAALKLFNSNYLTEYPNINICGIMAMATFTNNQEQIAKEFQSLINIQNHISDKYPILSIGMSGDYEIAVKCGSNMVRLGSAIFQ